MAELVGDMTMEETTSLAELDAEMHTTDTEPSVEHAPDAAPSLDNGVERAAPEPQSAAVAATGEGAAILEAVDTNSPDPPLATQLLPTELNGTSAHEVKHEEPPASDVATVPVKIEEDGETQSVDKRKEPSTPEQDGVVDVSESTPPEEPIAKRLKVAPKPLEAPSTGSAPTPTIVPATAAVSAPLMMSRDDMAKMEEDDGLLKFDVITNDGTPEHMIQLTTLKNIFARQLPKMPREYIVRLVFDRNHRSMVILKNGKQVIGGICYRPFEPNHFAEIAFCAINAADQVKGYGTRLMNHLKEYVKASGITHFLTYADNYAIGYFKKQGFAKVVSMPRTNWFGYIKDYDGGTLMECTIHHQINYLRITSMVHAQRKKIQEKIKERSHAGIIYPGLTKFAEGRTMDLYMIPGVQEAGWSRAVIRNSRVGTRDPGSLKTQLQQLWKHVSSHRSAWPFHEPVDTSIVVDYLDYIKEPVDLTLIQKRIESGHYLSKAAFKEDLDKMCNNCMIYNTPDTNYYKAAKDLQEFIDKRVQVAK